MPLFSSVSPVRATSQPESLTAVMGPVPDHMSVPEGRRVLPPLSATEITRGRAVRPRLSAPISYCSTRHHTRQLKGSQTRQLTGRQNFSHKRLKTKAAVRTCERTELPAL
jgi:hypothetical protein